jgi:uncharacterized damage-inducible protein DinB
MERLLHQYFRLLVRYNAWANQRVCDRCAAMDDAQYRNARTASGKTAHELLNVRLATDRTWLDRLRGYVADERSIGEELHATVEALREAQLAEDIELIDYVEALSEEDLLRPTAYETGSGEHHTNAQYELLSHLFTDQTAWRGRVSELLHPAPDLDMLSFFRDVEGGHRPLRP